MSATADRAVRNRIISLPRGVDVWILKCWFNADETEFKNAAKKVYRYYYYQPIKGGELPEIVAVISFNILVNRVPRLAARFLKSTAHIEEPIAKVSEINRLIISPLPGYCGP